MLNIVNSFIFGFWLFKKYNLSIRTLQSLRVTIDAELEPW